MVPSGFYYIMFDIPRELQRLVTVSPCQGGEIYSVLGVPSAESFSGVRVSCYHSMTFGHTVLVKPGQITEYPRHEEITYSASLPSPVLVGTLNANGNAEVLIINDYEVALSLNGLRSEGVEISSCETCQAYIGVGPGSCQAANRPQTVLRIPPGEYQVGANAIFSTTVQWTLQGDKRYQACFFVVAR